MAYEVPSRPIHRDDLRGTFLIDIRGADSGAASALRQFIDVDLPVLIKTAQWFDFGTVAVDTIMDAAMDASSFLQNGLMLMPYPRTIFRLRLDLKKALEETPVPEAMTDDILELLKGPKQLELVLLIEQDPETRNMVIGIMPVRGLHHEFLAVTEIVRVDRRGTSVSLLKNKANMWDVHMVAACWLILNTKHITTTVDTPSEKLNKARVKSGKAPLLPVTRVDSGQYVTALRATMALDREARGAGGIPRKSPKMHLRRAHLRHYENGKVTPIHAMIINAKEGVELVRDRYVRKS